MLVYPSLLPIFDKVGNDHEALLAAALAAQKAGADGLHLDFMAPPAVSRTTFTIDIINYLREGGITVPLDVHLMTGPEWIRKMPLNAIQSLTFHSINCASVSDTLENLAYLQEIEIEGGIAIDLEEYIEPLTPLLSNKLCSRALVMTVQAGAGGQPFQPQALAKIKKIHEINSKIKIMVDGGITIATLPQAAQAGADAAVAGSAIFNNQDIENNIKNLRLATL